MTVDEWGRYRRATSDAPAVARQKGLLMAVRVEFTLPDDFYARLEAARGDMPRASFIKRALERYVNGQSSVGPVVTDSCSVTSKRYALPVMPLSSDIAVAAASGKFAPGQCPECFALSGHQRGCSRQAKGKR